MNREAVAVLFLLGFVAPLSWGLTDRLQKNLIDWKRVKPLTWNDFERWKVGRRLMDENPAWRERLIDNTHRESLGRTIDCIGDGCSRFRGTTKVKVDTDNDIAEGDEVNTDNDSRLWIFLLDGTLVHMTPNSSLTIKEINIGKKDVFYHARLNYGRILWLSRSPSLPTQLYTHLIPLVRDSNHFVRGKSHHLLLVMPNGTVALGKGNAEFYHVSFGKSYAKVVADDVLLRLPRRKGYATFFYRGLENSDNFTLKENTWHEIGSRGERVAAIDNAAFPHRPEHAIEDLVLALIKRELLLQSQSQFLFDASLSKEQLAKHGYRLWSGMDEPKGELKARRNFLLEHTRKSETLLLVRTRKYLQELLNKSGVAK